MAEYNDLSCIQNLANTGIANCLDNLQEDAMLIYTLDSFAFASVADASDQSKYEDAINARTMFPFPQFEEIEPTSEDDVIQETGIGLKLFVREGKYGATGRFQLAMCNSGNLRTFNNVLGRAFIVTGNGKIWGTSPDGTVFKGFKLSDWFLTGLKGTDGTVKRMVDLRYQFKNPNEMFDFPAIPVLTWDPLELSGLINCVVTVPVGFTASSVIVSVLRACDAEAVVGLVEADFTMLDAAGATVLPATTFTDNADGTYTFAFTTPLASEAHTVNLKAASAQTTGGYASATAASFTIP